MKKRSLPNVSKILGMIEVFINEPFLVFFCFSFFLGGGGGVGGEGKMWSLNHIYGTPHKDVIITILLNYC